MSIDLSKEKVLEHQIDFLVQRLASTQLELSSAIATLRAIAEKEEAATKAEAKDKESPAPTGIEDV